MFRPWALIQTGHHHARLSAIFMKHGLRSLNARASSAIACGGEVLKQDSTAFRVLQDFVRSRQNATTTSSMEPQFNDDSRSLFENTKKISDQRRLFPGIELDVVPTVDGPRSSRSKQRSKRRAIVQDSHLTNWLSALMLKTSHLMSAAACFS